MSDSADKSYQKWAIAFCGYCVFGRSTVAEMFNILRLSAPVNIHSKAPIVTEITVGSLDRDLRTLVEPRLLFIHFSTGMHPCLLSRGPLIWKYKCKEDFSNEYHSVAGGVLYSAVA